VAQYGGPGTHASDEQQRIDEADLLPNSEAREPLPSDTTWETCPLVNGATNVSLTRMGDRAGNVLFPVQPLREEHEGNCTSLRRRGLTERHVNEQLSSEKGSASFDSPEGRTEISDKSTFAAGSDRSSRAKCRLCSDQLADETKKTSGESVAKMVRE
jgi:hypothetical protein